MKFNYVISLILIYFNLGSYAQVVEIPDPNFKNALLELDYVNTNGDDEIQVSEAEAVISLHVNEKGINSLEGINAFVNIEVLACEDNNLTELDISQLNQLSVVRTRFNKISSFVFPSPNNIVWLYASNNNLSDLSSINLESFISISILELNENPIGPMLELSNESLKKLSVDQCNLEEIDLSTLPNLESLNASYNPLVLDSPLSSDSLKYLTLGDCGLEDLNTSDLPILEALTVSLNNITNLNLEDNLNLRWLNVGSNNFTELDISHLPLMQAIYVNDNNLNKLIIKNGLSTDEGELLAFGDNPELSFICADDGELATVNTWLDIYGYTDVTVTTDCSLSVTDNSTMFNWSAFPNPTNGHLTVESSKFPIKHIEVFDLSGRLLKKVTVNSLQANLQLEELRPSVYFLKVHTAMSSSLKRIILK